MQTARSVAWLVLVVNSATFAACGSDSVAPREETMGGAEAPEEAFDAGRRASPEAGRADSGGAHPNDAAGEAPRGSDDDAATDDRGVVTADAAVAHDAGPVEVSCDPADKTAPAKVIQFSGKDTWLWENGAKNYEPEAVTDTDTPNTGPYKVTIEVDPTAETFTIYRPERKDRLLPVVAWANGGCIQDGTMTGEFLKEIASYGFLIIADGVPGGFAFSPQDGTRQTAMIDWAIAENQRPCSTYYHTLDVEKVAVTGGSCGGLMTFSAAPDPRVTTAVLWNSGLFERDPALYASLHAPMAIFDGGEEDPATENARLDVEAITTVPVLFANDKRGHAGYQWDDNGGEASKVGVAWFNWQLLGDTGPSGKGTFVGPDCSMCKNTKVWTDVSWKNEALIKN